VEEDVVLVTVLGVVLRSTTISPTSILKVKAQIPYILLVTDVSITYSWAS
jgi:hypothetical protein